MANVVQTSWSNGKRPSKPIVSVNYFPSDGVSSADVASLSSKMQSNLSGLGSDYSFSIADKPINGLNQSSLINQGNSNAQVGEAIYTSFSNGHHSMFETAANQVRQQIAKTGSYDIPTVLVSYEGMTSDAYGNAQNSKANMQFLAEQGIPYVFASSQGKSAAVEAGFANPYAESGYYVGEYLRAGGTVYVIDLDGAAHSDNAQGFMQRELDNNFIGALAGNGQLNESSDKYKGIYKYEVDPKTGQLIKTKLSKEEFLSSVKEESYSAAGKTVGNNINNLYGNSSSLQDFANNFNGGSGATKTLASDLAHVYSSMDNLQSLITPAESKQVSSGGIISTMDSAQSHYCNITNKMLGTLSGEIGAVKSIAEAIYNMDGAASFIAKDNLCDGFNSFMSGVNFNQKDLSTINSFNNTLGNEISNFLNNVNYDSFQPFNDLSSIGSTSISDLNRVMSNAIGTFENDKQNAREMRSVLDDFSSSIGDNNILSGELWDSVKNNMDVYSGLMSLREEASEYMIETFKIATEMIQEAIAPDASMDATKLPELEASLRDVNTQIQQLTTQVANMKASQHEECSYDENNEPYDCHEVPSDADIAAVEASLAQYEAQKVELETEIERINNYIEAVNKAQQLINEAIAHIDGTFGKAAESLKNNGTLPADISLDFSAYQTGEYKKYLDNFNTRLTSATSLAANLGNVPNFLYNLGKYSSNPEIGFDLWLSKNRYGNVDFAQSQLRQLYGYDENQALEAFIGVCIAESDKTRDDTLGVASVALNRCQVPNWAQYYKNGSNPFDQMFANGGSQYETITNVSHYYGNLHSYEAYMPSVVGLDNVNKVLAQYGTDYDTLKSTVMDAVAGGVRNNFYTGFRANGYEGWSDVHITPGGNKYHFEGYGGRDQAFISTLKSGMTATSLASTTGAGTLKLLVENGASMTPGTYGNVQTSGPKVTTLEYHQPPTTSSSNGANFVQLSSGQISGSSSQMSGGYTPSYTPNNSYNYPISREGVTTLKHVEPSKEYNPITFGKPLVEIKTEPFMTAIEFPTENTIVYSSLSDDNYIQPQEVSKLINNETYIPSTSNFKDSGSYNEISPRFVSTDKPEIINLDTVITEDPVITNIKSTNNEYIETPYYKSPITNEQNIIEPTTNSKSSLVSMGITSGVGLAVGAAALGAHSLLKKDEKEKEDEGYYI